VPLRNHSLTHSLDVSVEKPIQGVTRDVSIKRCAYIVDSRDIPKTEQDQSDDATKTSTAGKQADEVKTSDVHKVEVRNVCCVNLIL